MDTTVFGKIRRSSTFLSILGYKAADGSISDYLINFHVSYMGAVEESKAIIVGFLPTADELDRFPDIMAAREALIDSFNRTLSSTEEPLKAPYVAVLDDDGKPIKGIKRHAGNGEVHLSGLIRHKRVIEASGKTKSARPMSAKDYLKDLTPVGRFRQFKLTPGNFREIRVEGHSLASE